MLRVYLASYPIEKLKKVKTTPRMSLPAKDMILSIDISQDSNLVAYGGMEKLSLWEENTKKLRTLKKKNAKAYAVLFINYQYSHLCFSSGSIIQVYNCLTFTPSFSLRKHKKTVRCLVYDERENILFSGGEDCRIIMWSIAKRSAVKEFIENDESPIINLGLTTFGDNFYSACENHEIHIWDLEAENKVINEIKDEDMRMIDFSKDGVKYLYVKEQTIVVKEFKSDEVILEWKVKSKINSIKFGGNGETIIFGGADQLVSVINLNAHPLKVLQYKGLEAEITFVEISDKIIAAGTDDGQIQHWRFDYLTREYKNMREITKSQGHLKNITSICLNQNLIASAGEDFRVNIWNIPKQEKISTYNVEGEQITSISFTVDNLKVIVGTEEGVLILINLSTERKRVLDKTHNQTVMQIKTNSKIMACGSKDSSISIWDVDYFNRICVLIDDSIGVNSIELGLDGEILISGGDDKKVKVWDLKNGNKMKEFDEHNGVVACVVISPNQCSFVSCDDQCFLRLWDFKTCVKEINDMGNKIEDISGERSCSIAFINSGRSLVCAKLNSIGIFDCNSWILTKTITLDTIGGNISSGIIGKGEFFAYSCGKNIVLQQGVNRVCNFPIKPGHEGNISDIFWKSEDVFITAGYDSSICIWSFVSFRKKRELWEHTGRINGMKKGENSFVSFSDTNNELIVWSLVEGDDFKILHKKNLENKIQKIDYGFTSKKYSILTSREVFLMDSLNFELEKVREFPIKMELNRDIKFYMDDTMLLICGDNQSYSFYSITEQKEKSKNNLYRGPLTRVEIHPSNKNFVVGGLFGDLALVNIEEKKVAISFPGHGREIVSIIFCDNGETFYSGGDDYQIFLWDTFSGQKLIELKGNVTHIRAMALSPTGEYLSSCSKDSQIRIWKNFQKEREKILSEKNDDIPENVSSLSFNNDTGDFITTVTSFTDDSTSLKSWKTDGIFLKRIDTNFIQKRENITITKFCPVGKFLVLGTQDKVYILNGFDFSLKCECNVRSPTTFSFFNSLTRDFLFIGNAFGQIFKFIISSQELTQLHKVIEHKDKITSLFYVEKNMVISTSVDSVIYLWKLDDRMEVIGEPVALQTDEYFIGMCDVNKIKMLLAVPSRNRKINIYHLGKEEKITDLQEHLSPITCVAFDVHGNSLLSGDTTGKILVWNINSFSLIYSLSNHLNPITNLQFSPNGISIISSSLNEKTLLYTNNEQFYFVHLMYEALKEKKLSILIEQNEDNKELFQKLFHYKLYPFQITLLHLICYLQDVESMKEIFRIISQYEINISIPNDIFGINPLEASLDNLDLTKIIASYFQANEGNSSVLTEEILSKLVIKQFPQIAELLDSSLVSVKSAPKMTEKLIDDYKTFEDSSLLLTTKDFYNKNYVAKAEKSRVNVFYVDIHDLLSFGGNFLPNIANLSINNPIFESKVNI